MDAFDQAVLYLVNAANRDPALKAQAQAVLDQASKEGGIRFALSRFSSSNQPEVRFWALQYVAKVLSASYHELSVEERDLLRQCGSSWFPSIGTQPAYIANKFALVLTLLCKNMYPEVWPGFFDEVLQHLQRATPETVSTFLRVLDAIEDEIVMFHSKRSKAEVEHNTLIKDSMKATCMPMMAEAWLTIIVSMASSHPHIVQQCLITMHKYIGWIDINLVANDRFIPRILELLGSEVFEEGASLCLQEIFCKRMEAPRRIAFLRQLQAPTTLTAALAGRQVVTQRVASLISGVIAEILEAWWTLRAQPESAELAMIAEEMLMQLMPATLQCLASRDDQAASECVGFFQQYLRYLSRIESHTDAQEQHLTAILAISLQQIQYPDDLDPNEDIYEDEEFRDFRGLFANLFRGVAKIDFPLAVEFTLAALKPSLEHPEAVAFNRTEAGLYYVFLIKELEHAVDAPTVSALLQTFFSSNLFLNPASHPHPCVTLGVMEILVRYATHLASQQQHLPHVVTIMLDHSRMPVYVRARACYLFAQLTKVLRGELRGMLPTLLPVLAPALVVNPDPSCSRLISPSGLPFDDIANLYEAVGLLVGSDKIAPEHVTQMLVDLLSPLHQHAEAVMQRPQTLDTIRVLAQLLKLMSQLTKGCHHSRLTDPAVLAKPLAFALTLVQLTAQSRGGVDPEITIPIFSFLHTSVQAMGPAMLGPISEALPPIIQVMDPYTAQSVLTFINNLIEKMKDEFAGGLGGILALIIDRVMPMCNVTTTPGSVLSDDERDAHDLRKVFLSTVHHTLHCNLHSLLAAPQMGNRLTSVLHFVMAGAGDADMAVSKACFTILKRCVVVWAPRDSPTHLPAFAAFALSDILPLSVRVPMGLYFNLNDGAANSTLLGIVMCQKEIFTACGNEEAGTVLSSNILPAFQFDLSVGQQYATIIANSSTSDPNPLLMAYREMLVARKLKTPQFC
eukprot:c8606_g1_i1.p1 GENE.c8606_g1_i1~~c8606_g1_i1.p1  ORF type:complete len:962 (-),score=251.22 c8606_g1_i1:26-2911(-)